MSCHKYPDIPPIEVTSSGVVNLLTKLNVNKSTGPDGISPYILKGTAHELSRIIFIAVICLIDLGLQEKFLLIGAWPYTRKAQGSLGKLQTYFIDFCH